MIDLDELIKLDKAGCEHSGCTFGIHTLPKICAELRAARGVIEVLEHIIAMGHLTPDGSTEVWAKEALKKYDETRQE